MLGTSFRSQTSDNVDRWKSRGGKSQSGEEKKWRRSQKRKSEKKEDAGARKGRKAAIHCVFPMIWGSGGSKSNLAKAAGAEPAGQMRDEKLHAVVAPSTFVNKKAENTSCSEHLLEVEMSKKCTPLWREAHFQVKSAKDDGFGPLLNAVVARSTFPSQKCTKVTGSDHFWTFRCRKSTHTLN